MDAAAPATARSKSASSKIMMGALPPSSIDIRLTVSEHCFIKVFPTGVEPVKENFLTMGLLVISVPMAREFLLGKIFNKPEGRPARWASSAKASAESGVSCAGFITMAQPAARAGCFWRRHNRRRRTSKGVSW